MVEFEEHKDTHDEQPNDKNATDDDAESVQYVLNPTETPDENASWIPQAPDADKPFVGKVFLTLDDAHDFYERYGAISGFGIKKYTQKKLSDGVETISEKHYACTKEGKPRKKSFDTMDPNKITGCKKIKKPERTSNSKLTGCKAKIVCKLVSGSKTMFKIVQFVEEHNHMMAPDEYTHLLRTERQLRFSEQSFIFKVGTINMGPTKAHNIYKSIKGSYDNVHGTIVDFKNFKRDINAYMGQSDAHMLITKMKNTATYVKNFSFEYKVDDSRLSAMFWADDVAKAHYKEFGDIVSFDATYKTNR